MKVSVLIPLYNSEKYIAETILCALNQTWKNKEIIVVNDGSSDQSLKIAKSFESDVVKVYFQSNKGAAAARNHAFRLSTGDYIQYLDADDLISRDKIEKQMQLASVYGYDPEVLYTSKTNFFTDKLIHSEGIDQATDYSYNDPIQILADFFRYNTFMPVHGYLTPRWLIEQSSGWNEALSANDDGEFFARIIRGSKKIVFSSESVVFYRNIHDSLSKQKSLVRVLSEFKSLKSICEIILEHNNSEESRSACSNVFNLFIYDWFPANKPVLKEVEKTMEQMKLTFFSESESKVFYFVKKYTGWRRALLISQIISKIKRKN